MSLRITKENFETEVINSQLPVLLDFWAPWCGPCRAVAPAVDELSEEVRGIAKVGKVNVDEELELARAFGVSSIPTLVVIRDGRVIARAVGVQSKQALRQMLGS